MLKIESFLNDRIDTMRPVGGGCISDAQIISLKSGKSFFLKINNSSNDMFIKEANGLRELRKANAIRVPEVVLSAENFILLENIQAITRVQNFFEDFGRKFAAMHQYTSDGFGFFENNYIGSTVQLNTPADSDWKNFYWEKRILYQIELAEKNGCLTDELLKAVSRLEDKLDVILNDSENIPCLLHGDLWSGNYIVDNKGEACIIDPAVYYGNREADLAMTKLFGGFSNEFYDSYHEAYPLPGGCKFRENFYKLYHVLNHLNLFGRSYYSQSISLIRFYL